MIAETQHGTPQENEPKSKNTASNCYASFGKLNDKGIELQAMKIKLNTYLEILNEQDVNEGLYGLNYQHFIRRFQVQNIILAVTFQTNVMTR